MFPPNGLTQFHAEWHAIFLIAFPYSKSWKGSQKPPFCRGTNITYPSQKGEAGRLWAAKHISLCEEWQKQEKNVLMIKLPDVYPGRIFSTQAEPEGSHQSGLSVMYVKLNKC